MVLSFDMKRGVAELIMWGAWDLNDQHNELKKVQRNQISTSWVQKNLSLVNNRISLCACHANVWSRINCLIFSFMMIFAVYKKREKKLRTATHLPWKTKRNWLQNLNVKQKWFWTETICLIFVEPFPHWNPSYCSSGGVWGAVMHIIWTVWGVVGQAKVPTTRCTCHAILIIVFILFHSRHNFPLSSNLFMILVLIVDKGFGALMFLSFDTMSLLSSASAS